MPPALHARKRSGANKALSRFPEEVKTLLVGLGAVAMSIPLTPVILSRRFDGVILIFLLLISLALLWVGRLPWLLSCSLPYLALMTAWARDFAYVGIGPVYVTELYLVTVAPLCLWWAVRRYSGLRPSAFVPWACFVAFVLFKVITAETFGMEALRNSVIGFYSVFYLIGWYLGRDHRHATAVIAAIAIGVLMNLGPLLINVATKSTWEQFRISGGNQVGAALGILLILVASRWAANRIAAYVFLPVLGYELLVFYHRSVWLGVAVAALVVLAFEFWHHRSLRNIPVVDTGLKMLPGFALVVVLFLLTPWYLGDGAEAALTKLMWKFNLGEEGNATWRWWAWSTAFDTFLQSPLVGISMDRPILPVTYRDVPTDDPHNSFLALLVRVGIIGFGLFLWFWGSVIVRVVRSLLASSPARPEYRRGLFFFAVHVTMAIFAALNVVLEGPHHGMLFWLSLGLAAGTGTGETSSSVSSAPEEL